MLLLSSLDYWIGVALLVGLTLSFGLAVYCGTIAQVCRRRVFRRRAIIPFKVWYDTHYRDLDEERCDDVEAIVRVFSDEIGVHPTQLLPPDRVTKDYALRGVCSLLDDSWEVWIIRLPGCFEKIVGRPMTDEELTFDLQWVTLDDFVRGMVTIVRDAQAR